MPGTPEKAFNERLQSDPELQRQAAENIARILERNGYQTPKHELVARELVQRRIGV